MTRPAKQLLVYRFEPGARLEGQFVGALERMESGGTLKVADVLVVANDPETGELAALGVRGKGVGGFVAALLGFRLDAGERRKATRRATADPERAELVRQLGDGLEPGVVIAAVLIEHVWVAAVADAASRTGGAPLADTFVDAEDLAGLGPELLAARGRTA
jgi:hypothetical protein